MGGRGVGNRQADGRRELGRERLAVHTRAAYRIKLVDREVADKFRCVNGDGASADLAATRFGVDDVTALSSTLRAPAMGVVS